MSDIFSQRVKMNESMLLVQMVIQNWLIAEIKEAKYNATAASMVTSSKDYIYLYLWDMWMIAERYFLTSCLKIVVTNTWILHIKWNGC